MTNKVKTMDLAGKEYAKVAERLKAFREENPKGKVETDFSQLPDGKMVLKATVTKEDGTIATGQSFGELKQQKAFEKLESIAVGRALAFLGYLASGEIASSDEMEEFMEYQSTKAQEAIETLEKCTTLDELKEAYKSLGGMMSNEEVIKAKDSLKTRLQ